MRNRKHISLIAAALALLLILPVGCGQKEPELTLEDVYTDSVDLGAEEIDIADEAIALSNAPALDLSLTPTPSGTQTKSNQRAIIDYSNTSDGYVMVNFTGSTSTRIKVLVMGPNTSTADTRYQYDLPVKQWVTFPLSDGDGKYTVKVMEQNSSGKYSPVVDASFSVALTDEFAPYLRPNQFVNCSEEVSPNTIAEARRVTEGLTDPLQKVEAVYNFVVNNLTYDTAKAEKVKKGQLSGYLPVLDDVLAAKTGICFDYAALMSGMLRSQGVPCKLITGYVSTGYHAWISVWTEEQGWVDGAIYFDGTTWHRMDPTFASSGKGVASMMKFIGDGSNYQAKNAY